MREHLPYAQHYCTYQYCFHPSHVRHVSIFIVILSSLLSRSSLWSTIAFVARGVRPISPSHPDVSCTSYCPYVHCFPLTDGQRLTAIRNYNYGRITVFAPRVGRSSGQEITYIHTTKCRNLIKPSL